MKASRIIQFILLALVAVYLVLVHNDNVFMVLPVPLLGKFRISPALVIAVAFILGYLIGFLPTQTKAWRKGRESNKLQKRITELEERLPDYAKDGSKKPIIPDRSASDDLNA